MVETTSRMIEYEQLGNALISQGYKRCEIRNNPQIFIKARKWKLGLFMVVHSQGLSFKTLKKLDNILGNFLKEYCKMEQVIKRICLTVVICVDGGEINRELIDQKVYQEIGRYWMPVFYSSLKEELYIPKQRSRLGRRQYNRMYREFEEILKRIA